MMHAPIAPSEPASIEITKAKGGFIVRHRFESRGESYTPPQEYVFATKKALLVHLSTYLQLGDAGAEAADTPAAPGQTASMAA